MFFESFLLNLTVILVLIVALIFDYVTKFFSYWYIRHIPYKMSIPFFGSDYHRVLGFRSTTEEVNRLYTQYRSEKFVGCIKSRIPDLIIKDTNVARKILSTDFSHFHCRGLALDRSQDVCLRNNLFYAEGEKWTLLREGLESLLKSITWDCKYSLQECLSGTSGDVNVQRLLSKILDTAFHHILIDNNNVEINNSIISNLRSTLQKRTIIGKLKSYLKSIFPSLYVLFGLTTISGQTTKKTLYSLEKSKIMNELMRIKSEIGIKEKNVLKHNILDSEFCYSVLTSFITEGFVPIENVLIAMLYEVAKNPEVQRQARECKTQSGTEDYLDSVIKETLRLHPPYSVITRQCTKTYKFPEKGLLIDKGVTITIPVEAIHRDDKYYEEPNIFKPQRFFGVDVKNISFLPFGVGPRKCIGEELSLQIIRSVSKTILQEYNIEICDKTPAQLSAVDYNFCRIVKKDIWLRFTPIST